MVASCGDIVAAPVIPKRLRRIEKSLMVQTILSRSTRDSKEIEADRRATKRDCAPPVAAPVIPKRLRRPFTSVSRARQPGRSTRDSKEIEAAHQRQPDVGCAGCRSTRDSKEIEAETSDRSARSDRLCRSTPRACFDNFGRAEMEGRHFSTCTRSAADIPILQEISADFEVRRAVSVRNNLSKIP